MCGIVGIIGSREYSVSGKELVECLKRLEYRGYDSSGITTLTNESLQTVKNAGRIQNIEQPANHLYGTAGIGHTRWATHGAATEANAHPHYSDQVSLVHNGIIENWYELKTRFPGHPWKGETDTEVILQLLTEAATKGIDPLLSLQSLVQELKGSFSLAIIFKNHPEALYAVRKSMPLLVGTGNQRHVIVSDLVAFPPDCQMAANLPDFSITVVKAHKVAAWSFSGEQKELVFKEQQSSTESIGHGHYENFMIKEIHEQPKIIRSIVSERIDHTAMDINAELAGVQGLNLGKIDRIKIVACGTAWHAALLGKYYLESFTHYPVSVELASESRYSDQHLSPKNLIIAISQSGETADTLACVDQAAKAKCQILAFCNRPQAEMPRLATKTIHLNCGQEVSVASTKAFLSMIFNLYVFALGCGRNRGTLKKDAFHQKLLDLQKVPQAIENTLALSNQIQTVYLSFQRTCHPWLQGLWCSFWPITLRAKSALILINHGILRSR